MLKDDSKSKINVETNVKNLNRDELLQKLADTLFITFYDELTASVESKV